MSDIGDEKNVQKAEAKAKSARDSRAIVIRVLTQKREGRDFLWWILEQGSPYQSTMRYDESGRADALRIAYVEGWRNLASLIMSEVMNADPNGYVRMLTENRTAVELEKINERRTDTDN